MAEKVLSIQGLVKSFRRGRRVVRALKGVSFDILPGTITGFLGANGAGKTTTVKCVLGLSLPDAGEIRFFGQSKLSADVKARIGFLPERPYFYEYLTGREFLRFYGELSNAFNPPELRQRIERLLTKVGLEHAGDRALRSYSKGMLQRIGIAQALIHEPEFIILDEPMTGLDPDGRQDVRDIIRATARSGTAVFFSSHLLPDAEQLCERLVILKSGEIVYSGPTDKLLNQVESGYQLVARRGEQIETSHHPTIEHLQLAIDQKRNEKESIIEVKHSRLSLEEAFIRIGMRQK